MDDAVDRQLAAYNRRDLDGFLAAYAPSVVLEDADGNVEAAGLDALRERYGALFAASPGLHARVVARIRLGRRVVDEEHVTGHRGRDLHAVVIYRLDDAGLIDHVRIVS